MQVLDDEGTRVAAAVVVEARVGASMVNFAEELRSQLVPEWQDAYCSYDELKQDLHDVEQHGTVEQHPMSRTGSLGLLRSLASVKPGLHKTLTRNLTQRGREGYQPLTRLESGRNRKILSRYVEVELSLICTEFLLSR